MKETALFLFSCFIVGILSASAGEQLKVSGKVIDDLTEEPIKGVIVSSKGSFTSTKADGSFSIVLKTGSDSVSFRSLGYVSLTKPVNESMREVRMKQKAVQLNDVIVEAPDIYARGDTLVFNVARYANAKDNAIIDVIKRLPGIKVEKDGTIKYQGKPINKLYIDGNDFISGQYSLATENISHKDVKSVEVMENHQPVKALEGIEFPEEAGINLKLKDDARGRWVGVAQAGIGIQPLLLNGSIYMMRIASKIQNVFTLKGDNTGWNPQNEIKEREFDEMFSSYYSPSLWPQYISADKVSIPLSEKRTRDNLSWLANSISAWKSGDATMRLKFNYMGDRLDFKSGLITDYFSAEIPTFLQDNSLRIKSHDISAQFNGEINKRGYFLKDKLTVNAGWNNSTSSISGSFSLNQNVKRKSFSVNNDLKLVKRNDKKLFTLISRNTYMYSPDRLNVVREENSTQRIDINDFRSTTESQIGRFRRFWKYYLTAGLDLNFHRIYSHLSGMGSFDNMGTHDAFLSNVYAIPQVDYERNEWRASLKMPVKWIHQSISGQHEYVDLSPSLYLRRQLSAKSDISGSIGYILGSPQAYLYYGFVVLTDYRNIYKAGEAGGENQGINSSISYRYRNPLKSFFFNVSGSYAHSKSSLMSNQIFFDDLIIGGYAKRMNNSNLWSLKSGISKGLAHSRMVLGIDANLSCSSASSMRDGDVISFKQTGIQIKPYFKGSLLSWLSVSYDISYGYTKLKIDIDKSISQTLHQNLYTTIIPDDRIQFTVGAEHYLTRFPEGNSASLVLLDAACMWPINNRMRLSLTANNLLDSKDYRYITFGTLSQSEHIFNIRKRSIILSYQLRF